MDVHTCILVSLFVSILHRYIAGQDAIPPLCDLLSMMDSKIILVALSGIENILRTGEAVVKEYGGQNVYALQVEECFGE